MLPSCMFMTARTPSLLARPVDIGYLGCVNPWLFVCVTGIAALKVASVLRH